ncbi:MAG: helix-turn-helix domain-containing protein [Ferrovibrio sp.]|uniref:helix-turn-helix domain-containing protein n=1 Tax=Ferrovibrio sp. TaxID=1917215 RepID=UPI002617F55C|nr:helix-turn-helix transcriptional regulator [Ferrovibrio sp.]MCW0232570.1 helix-turn-helix domain-containing protein [Ferrovibrio sp.]
MDKRKKPTPAEARQKALGRRIKALRKERKLSQEDLAEMIGKSVDTVSNIERGFSSTRLSTVFEIAEALKVGFIDLFDWADVPKQTAQQKARAELVEKFRILLEGNAAVTVADIAELTRAISEAATRR